MREKVALGRRPNFHDDDDDDATVETTAAASAN